MAARGAILEVGSVSGLAEEMNLDCVPRAWEVDTGRIDTTCYRVGDDSTRFLLIGWAQHT